MVALGQRWIIIRTSKADYRPVQVPTMLNTKPSYLKLLRTDPTQKHGNMIISMFKNKLGSLFRTRSDQPRIDSFGCLSIILCIIIMGSRPIKSLNTKNVWKLLVCSLVTLFDRRQCRHTSDQRNYCKLVVTLHVKIIIIMKLR